MNIGIYLSSRSDNYATYRIRAKLIIENLKKLNHNVVINPKSIAGFDKILIYKVFNDELIEKIKKSSCEVYLDLSDNYLATNNREKLFIIIKKSKKIIVSSEFIKSELVNFGINSDKIYMLPDFLESDCIKNQLCWSIIRAKTINLYYKLRLLKYKNHTKLIWYGNFGDPKIESGLYSLNKIKNELEELSGRNKIVLTVCTNDYYKYLNANFLPRINTIYVPWNRHSIQTILKLNNICLIPIKSNSFTNGKSENRLITAITSGLVVCADVIPSYDKFKKFIYHGDNWALSLENSINNFKNFKNNHFPINDYNKFLLIDKFNNILFNE